MLLLPCRANVRPQSSLAQFSLAQPEGDQPLGLTHQMMHESEILMRLRFIGTQHCFVELPYCFLNRVPASQIARPDDTAAIFGWRIRPHGFSRPWAGVVDAILPAHLLAKTTCVDLFHFIDNSGSVASNLRDAFGYRGKVKQTRHFAFAWHKNSTVMSKATTILRNICRCAFPAKILECH